jgi:hypothetical protein
MTTMKSATEATTRYGEAGARVVVLLDLFEVRLGIGSAVYVRVTPSGIMRLVSGFSVN